jgi:hypothetical protein
MPALAPLKPFLILKPLDLAPLPLIPIPTQPSPILHPAMPYPITPTLAPPEPFLPTEEWQYIQDFNRAMADVQIDTCLCYQECWFNIKLKDSICQQYYL